MESVVVTAPCGGSRPIGKRTRRAERVPSDAEVAACEGDDETAVAQTGAEVRAACSAVWNFRINGRAVESV